MNQARLATTQYYSSLEEEGISVWQRGCKTREVCQLGSENFGMCKEAERTSQLAQAVQVAVEIGRPM